MTTYEQINIGFTSIQLNIFPLIQEKRICIAQADELTLVAVKDIVRCESKRNYTNILLQDKSSILASRTLGDFDEKLTPYGFYRVHHHSLINLAFIKGYRKAGGGTVLMLDNSEIPIATRRREEFVRYLKEIS